MLLRSTAFLPPIRSWAQAALVCSFMVHRMLQTQARTDAFYSNSARMQLQEIWPSTRVRSTEKILAASTV